MRIYIKSTMSYEYSPALEVECSDTVGSVKAKLVEKEGIPLHMQLLSFAKQLLEDDRTLADYNIGNENSIYLSFNLRLCEAN